MKRILKIGMDVHTTNYTLCAMEPIIGEDDRVFATIKVTPDYKNILLFIENLRMKFGLDDEYDIQCGYEAGCLGYSLYNQLIAAGVKCVILAVNRNLFQVCFFQILTLLHLLQNLNNCVHLFFGIHFCTAPQNSVFIKRKSSKDSFFLKCCKCFCDRNL